VPAQKTTLAASLSGTVIFFGGWIIQDIGILLKYSEATDYRGIGDRCK